MGLVGLLTLSLTTGTPFVLGAPTDFTSSPSRWMEWMSTYGGTATTGPNFSYVLPARTMLRAATTLTMSSNTNALNSLDPLDTTTSPAFLYAEPKHVV